MAAHKNDTLQGTLALLVLMTLLQGHMHGWGITERIEQWSDDVLQINQGSLYPALHRLIKRRWISVEDGTSENNRRAKYYSLTRAGKKRLGEELANWERLSAAIALVVVA